MRGWHVSEWLRLSFRRKGNMRRRYYGRGRRERYVVCERGCVRGGEGGRGDLCAVYKWEAGFHTGFYSRGGGEHLCAGKLISCGHRPQPPRGLKF